MERTSCLGCFITTSFFLAVFSIILIFVINRVFHVSPDLVIPIPITLSSLVALLMANKSLFIISCVSAIVPTFLASATVNEIHCKYKHRKAKELDEALAVLHRYGEQKMKQSIRHAPGTDFIHPENWKGPSRKPGTQQVQKEKDDK